MPGSSLQKVISRLRGARRCRGLPGSGGCVRPHVIPQGQPLACLGPDFVRSRQLALGQEPGQLFMVEVADVATAPAYLPDHRAEFLHVRVVWPNGRPWSATFGMLPRGKRPVEAPWRSGRAGNLSGRESSGGMPGGWKLARRGQRWERRFVKRFGSRALGAPLPCVSTADVGPVSPLGGRGCFGVGIWAERPSKSSNGRGLLTRKQ